MTNQEFHLKVETRGNEKAKLLRTKGIIPLVLYGHGIKPASLSIKKNIFDKIYSQAGKSTIINLEISDGVEHKTIIHDIQVHPVSGDIIHADIYKVSMKEKIETEIPIVVIGESKAIVELGGSLITNKSTLNISALPSDLIHAIEVDISKIDSFDKQIHVKDLIIPKTIEILDDIEEVIAFVQEPRSEEELAQLDEKIESSIEEVEVEKRGKEDEEKTEANNPSDTEPDSENVKEK